MYPTRKREWTRFIIYFIVVLFLYQAIKLFYTSFTKTTPQETQYQHQEKKSYKTQTILEFVPDNQTYLDFPWYQQKHTRPQFRPKANLTTTELSIKEREIMLQKAILQAKKRAQKKFLLADYTGIRGTRFTLPEETKALRDKVNCWTKGQWVKDDDNFQLKHLQDPTYSSCDSKFYKTHDESEKREALKYRWQPSSDCPLDRSIDAKNWCAALKGRNILLVGDLVHYQYHELLLDAFRDGPTVCFGELNCKGTIKKIINSCAFILYLKQLLNKIILFVKRKIRVFVISVMMYCLPSVSSRIEIKVTQLQTLSNGLLSHPPYFHPTLF